MLSCSIDRSINEIYLDLPVEEVWNTLVTPQGMNQFLTYKAEKSNPAQEISKGDIFKLNYGDIENNSKVIECTPKKSFTLSDHYESMTPDGTIEQFIVTTKFELNQKYDQTKLSLTVQGYRKNLQDQWLRECLELGWRRSLINLKSVLELGMDLRTSLFTYPRLGVTNCSNHLISPEGIEGNYIMHVFPNSPAEKAGLIEGDVVTNIGDSKTASHQDFVVAISHFQHSTDHVPLTYIRENQSYCIELPLSTHEIFTGQINSKHTTMEEEQKRREALAKQRSGAGSMWARKNSNE
ncbi:PDZ domain-containing protein [Fictibacillus enclensis]|uniref:SRPBCC domain-containing protein n=1 Tax=Fictibacillus enclensis TaxID=1017270 RepID=UPI0025A26C61|nr:SRPBCC domain-containing protein [Fictibacillus enclensis]MDM5335816.1 PDZ domain-containing protein [Fictibacillus enclensis]